MISRNLRRVFTYRSYARSRNKYKSYGYDALRTRCPRALARPFVSYEVFAPSINTVCHRNWASGGMVRAATSLVRSISWRSRKALQVVNDWGRRWLVS